MKKDKWWEVKHLAKLFLLCVLAVATAVIAIVLIKVTPMEVALPGLIFGYLLAGWLGGK